MNIIYIDIFMVIKMENKKKKLEGFEKMVEFMQDYRKNPEKYRKAELEAMEKGPMQRTLSSKTTVEEMIKECSEAFLNEEIKLTKELVEKLEPIPMRTADSGKLLISKEEKLMN